MRAVSLFRAGVFTLWRSLKADRLSETKSQGQKGAYTLWRNLQSPRKQETRTTVYIPDKGLICLATFLNPQSLADRLDTLSRDKITQKRKDETASFVSAWACVTSVSVLYSNTDTISCVVVTGPRSINCRFYMASEETRQLPTAKQRNSATQLWTLPELRDSSRCWFSSSGFERREN